MPAHSVVVAGHICLDIIPEIAGRDGGLEQLLVPGALVEIGPALLSTGGAVSNTGIALHRLGVPTRLMGKIGDDVFGDAIRQILRSRDPALAEGMLVTPGEPTSYTLVISPPGVDRLFLHCPGANDTFGSADVPYPELAGTKLFHFGYPPIMRRFYAEGGGELASLFRQVKQQGVATSLDLARPDPSAPAGRAPWREILQEALPHVDVFLPSIEEILFMLDRSTHDQMDAGKGIIAGTDGALLSRLSDDLLAMGTAVVAIKLGERGLYVRTTADTRRLAPIEQAIGSALDDWVDREQAVPCFEADVVGTTGCGDCTIAGFLAGLLRGQSLDDAMTTAVAVGACATEQADATSGVPSLEAVQRRLDAGWSRLIGGLEI